MLKVEEFEVFNMDNSLKAAGLPMRVSNNEELSADFKRGTRLGSVPTGTGHDCYLKGIQVYMLITAPVPFWGQWERYAFQDTISSTSQMHKLKDFDTSDGIFAEATPQESIDIVSKYQKIYNDDPTPENFRTLSMCVPQGFLYTRAVTTNYLQLKTMLKQRRHHKTQDWQVMCDFIESLPFFLDLTTKEVK